jgi:integrase
LPDSKSRTEQYWVIEPLKKKFPTSPGEIGFEYGRLHSFRHYFCSQAFADGAAEADIKDWLGHQDSKMVAHYRHQRQDDSQNKMNQIDFLGSNCRLERRQG